MGNYRRMLERERVRVEFISRREAERRVRRLESPYPGPCGKVILPMYGHYYPASGKIVLMRGMTPKDELDTFCHELAHHEERPKLLLVDMGRLPRVSAAVLLLGAVLSIAGAALGLLAAFGLGIAVSAAGTALLCWGIAIDARGVAEKFERRAERRARRIRGVMLRDRRMLAAARAIIDEGRTRRR